MRHLFTAAVIGVIILASLVLLLSTGPADADRFIDGNWMISGERIEVSNETIDVTGSLSIRWGGSLRLDNCTLRFNNTTSYSAGIYVQWDGNLEAVNSLIAGVGHRFRMSLNNESEFLGTTLRNLDGTGLGLAISISGGGVTMTDCLIEDVSGSIFEMDGDLRATNVTIRQFTRRVFDISYRTYMRSFSLILEDCLVEGDKYYHTSDHLLNVYTTVDEVYNVRVSIRNTTMAYLNYIGGFRLASDHILEFLGCTAIELGSGIGGEMGAGKLVIRDSLLCGVESQDSIGIDLSIIAAADVTISNVTICSFGTAIRSRPLLNQVAVRLDIDGVTIRDCATGLESHGIDQGVSMTLEVHRPIINATPPEEAFVAITRGFIEVYPDSYLPPMGRCDESGAITAYWTLDLEGATWVGDGGAPPGTVLLHDEHGTVVTTIDLSDPIPRIFVAWRNTFHTVSQLDSLFPSMTVSGHTFVGEEYDFWNDTSGEIYLIDDVTPTLTVGTPANSSLMNVSHVRAVGRYQELGSGLESLTVRLDGGAWSEAMFDLEGNWSMDLEALAEGDHDILVRVVDRAGNNMTVGPIAFRVDTVAPPLVLGDVPALVNTIELNVTGSTEPGAQLLAGGAPVAMAPDGNFNLSLLLVEGVNVLVVEAVDAAGNRNATVLEVVLDTIPPELTVDRPSSGSWTTDTTATIQGVVEAGATLTVDGETVGAPGGSFELLVDLPEGTVEIVVEATDAAGNVNRVVKVLHVDRTAPFIVMESPDRPISYHRDLTLELGGRVEDASPFTLKVNGQVVVATDGAFSRTYDLEEGENAFSLEAVDLAGNMGSLDLVVVRDTVPPVFEASLEPVDGDFILAGGVRYSTASLLRLTVTTGEETTLMLNGVPASGPGTEHEVDIELTEGGNDLLVRVVDRAGNDAVVQDDEVIYDTIPPSLTVMEPVPGLTVREPTVLVRGVALGADRVSVAGVEVTPGEDGTFMALVSLDKGSNLLKLEAWDAVGNHNATSLYVIYTPREGDAEGSEFPWAVVAIAVAVAASVALIVLILRRDRADGAV